MPTAEAAAITPHSSALGRCTAKKSRRNGIWRPNVKSRASIPTMSHTHQRTRRRSGPRSASISTPSPTAVAVISAAVCPSITSPSRGPRTSR
jgi:hypothetical protein